MALTVSSVAADLAAEHDALDSVVSALDAEQWLTPTASAGWTVADQIAHLTYFDKTATAAVVNPDEFQKMFEALFESAAGGEEAVDEFTIGWSRQISPEDLLTQWREGRASLLEAATTLAEDERVPWYGPSMGSKSFLTARLMETWAHGQDVVDAVDARRAATDRLRHIVQLGYITRKWTYANRSEEAPEQDVRVEVTSPSGEIWVWGEESANQSVTGSAEDFALVVCQRRHVADTSLTVIGEQAQDWMTKAQAFAGPATDGPPPS